MIKNSSKKGKKRKFLHFIVISVFISAVIYFGIAAVLIAGGKPDKSSADSSGIVFGELNFDYSDLPGLQNYTASDKTDLSYRYYPADPDPDKVVILLHGSGYHSRYLLPLARFISSHDLAHVYTPDLRGHGKSPARRGDIDYINQLEDDFADFATFLRKKHPDADFILGGHSSGGGLAVRFAGSSYGDKIDAYFLLSPYLKYNAPTMRPNSGGWAQPYTGRIAGLVMLNNIGIRWFNHLEVIRFNMPEPARDGTETLTYTYRLNRGLAPHDYKSDLAAVSQPLLVAAGTADNAFYADKFEPTVSKYTDARFETLDGVTHMGVAVGSEIRPVIKKWLKNLK